MFTLEATAPEVEKFEKLLTDLQRLSAMVFCEYSLEEEIECLRATEDFLDAGQDIPALLSFREQALCRSIVD
jgi:hypothetical protein